MVSLGTLSIYHIRQRLLGTPHGEDIFLLPKPGIEFFIGDEAPNLSRFTRRLRSGGLIEKVRRDRRAEHCQIATIWRTTEKFVEYCKRYGEGET